MVVFTRSLARSRTTHTIGDSLLNLQGTTTHIHHTTRPLEVITETTTTTLPALPSTSTGDKHYVHGYCSDTPLLHVAFDKFGTFLGMQNSMQFIPEKLVSKVRNIFIMYMDGVLANHDNLECWKKFLLLPIVLFSIAGSRSRKVDMRDRIQALEDNRWEIFTLGQLCVREEFHGQNDSDISLARKYNRVEKYAKQGNFTGAMKLLEQTLTPVQPSQDVYHALTEKHPISGLPPSQFSNLHQMWNYEITDVSNKIHISREMVLKVVRSVKKLIKHGMDKLRYEHIHQILGKGSEQSRDEVQFGDRLASILTMIANNDVPDALLPALRDNEIFAAPKKNGDVRPIAIGSVYRKLASIAIKNSADDFNRIHFGKLQMALASNGAEKIIHTFNTVFHLDGSKDIFAMDGENAFNSANRIRGLYEIFKSYPRALPLLRAMYGQPAHLWYYGLNDGIEPIQASEGFQQGDSLATWAYAMTIQPMLVHLQEILDADGFVQFFVDDGNIAGTTDKMIEAITYLQRHGSDFGYKLKMNSGAYLMAKCATSQEAYQKKEQLVALGLSEEIIKIHPDNLVYDDGEEAYAVEYGVKMLGGYIGTDAFVHNQLNNHLTKLQETTERLIEVPNRQIRMLLLRLCFRPKIYFLLRTTRPSLTQSLLTGFDACKRKVMASLIYPDGCVNNDIDDSTWDICRFGISEGGLGMDYLDDIRTAAFVASVVECHHIVSEHYPNYVDVMCLREESTSSFSTEFHDMVDCIHAVDESIDLDCIFTMGGVGLQKKFYDKLHSARWTSYWNQLTDPEHIAWLTSLQGSHAGAWLEAYPKTTAFTISNSEYQVMLRYRLRLSQSQIIAGTRCDCRHHPYLDSLGHHLITGCTKGGQRHRTHDMLKRELCSMMNYCGIWTKQEEVGIFRGSDVNNNMRPDISVLSDPITGSKIIMDVSITCPLPGAARGDGVLDGTELRRTSSVLTIAKAKDKGRAARTAAATKHRKYAQLAHTNGLGFEALIFESAGHMHEDTLKVLKQAAQHGEALRKVSRGRLLRFMTIGLSVCLQRGLANGFLQKIMHVNGRLGLCSNRYSFDLVDGYDRIHANDASMHHLRE